MRGRREVRGVLGSILSLLLAGCGRPAEGPKPDTPTRGTAGRRVVFVGFDASQPLVHALKQGKLQGLVVQNPYKMGHLGVRTLVDHLEMKEIPAKLSTG